MLDKWIVAHSFKGIPLGGEMNKLWYMYQHKTNLTVIILSENCECKKIWYIFTTTKFKNVQNILPFGLLPSYNFKGKEKNDKHSDIMVGKTGYI